MIFAKTRWVYDSYIHYNRLVDLSGFPTCFVDEIDWGSKNTYIISPINGELPSPLPVRNCRIVWVNIERRDCYPIHKFAEFDEVWVCDKEMARQTGSRYFLMGSDSNLGYYEPNKIYDFTTNCYDTGRRQTVFNAITSSGLSMAPNSFDLPDPNYAASRIQVLPQQDEPPHCITPLRFCIAAAYHMPLVYEMEGDTYPFINHRDFVNVPYASLVGASTSVLGSSVFMKALGNNLHQKLCVDTTFRQEVEKMI